MSSTPLQPKHEHLKTLKKHAARLASSPPRHVLIPGTEISYYLTEAMCYHVFHHQLSVSPITSEEWADLEKGLFSLLTDGQKDLWKVVEEVEAGKVDRLPSMKFSIREIAEAERKIAETCTGLAGRSMEREEIVGVEEERYWETEIRAWEEWLAKAEKFGASDWEFETKETALEEISIGREDDREGWVLVERLEEISMDGLSRLEWV